MSDRIFAFTVTLDHVMRDDDAGVISEAIKMIRGVLEVVPLVASPESFSAEMRVRAELREKLWLVLK